MAQSLKTKTAMDARVLDIVEPVADDLGYRIVRLRVQGGKRAMLQIMAERKADGQMDIDDCAKLSRELSSTLEVEDPIEEAYTLEVGSPGLDRPLTSPEDFEAYAGHLARVELDRMVEGRKRFRGVIDGFEDDHISLVLDGEDEAAQLPFRWVSEAKLLITDELIKAGQEARKAETSSTETDNG